MAKDGTMKIRVLRPWAEPGRPWNVHEEREVPSTYGQAKIDAGLAERCDIEYVVARYLASVECGIQGRHVSNELRAAAKECGVPVRGVK